jgi:hypothetical protein
VGNGDRRSLHSIARHDSSNSSNCFLVYIYTCGCCSSVDNILYCIGVGRRRLQQRHDVGVGGERTCGRAQHVVYDANDVQRSNGVAKRSNDYVARGARCRRHLRGVRRLSAEFDAPVQHYCDARRSAQLRTAHRSTRLSKRSTHQIDLLKKKLLSLSLFLSF